MTWQTHAAVGANAVWIAALITPVDERFFVLLAAGAVSALLPDIDAKHAKIHFIAGGALGLFKGMFKHRAFFHSFLAVALVYLVSFIFLRDTHPLLPLVIALGYASHPLIDGFNFSGVQYLFPKKKKYRLIPKQLASPVKGFTDQLLFVLSTTGIVLFVMLHLNEFATF